MRFEWDENKNRSNLAKHKVSCGTAISGFDDQQARWQRGDSHNFAAKGAFKKPLTIRLDADVLAWLKRQGKGYQTRINALFRSAMETAESDTFRDSTR